MENIREEETSPRTITLAERVKKLEEEKKIVERGKKTAKETRQFRFPFKWRRKFNQAGKKRMREMILVFFLNKKNEIEPPKFMPIFDGNMVVWKNKPYEFDPRAVWTLRGIRKNPKAYVIKEIDRRPVKNKFDKYMYADAAVSNLDLDKIRAEGDSTESDEFLIKAALKAQTTQMAKKAKVSIIAIIIILAVVCGVLWLILGGG